MTIDNMRECLDDKEFFYDGKRSVVFDTGDGRTYTLRGTEVPKKGPVVFRLKLAKEARKSKDIEKMNDSQLLRELVRRFIAYDKARDKYVALLEDTLDHVSIFYDRKRKTLASREFFIQKYGLDEKREKLHMAQDEKFCLCREIVRIVKKDPYYMWC